MSASVATHAGERTVALFGGSFNPPHLGHLGVCRHVLASAPLADEPGELWIVPAFRHPFGKHLAPFEDRLAMCELLVAELAASNARVRVSPVERDVPGEHGWTVDLLRHLAERHPELRFRLVLGADLHDERKRWKDFEELERLAPPIWVPRRGFEEANRELDLKPFLEDIRSADIRACVARGDDIEGYVGPAVAEYVRTHGLYRENA